MEYVNSSFVITFESPFWVGIYECEEESGYRIAKVTFGSEPKGGEVYQFILQRWQKLKVSESIEANRKNPRHLNPKRMQRQIKKQLEEKGIGTKAQQAVKLQQGEGKIARKCYLKKQKEQKKELKFNLKQDKRKEKHRGH